MRYKTHLFLLLFLFCLTIYGQGNSRISIIENKLELISVEHPEFGEKVNVNISNTTLSNFLLAISKVHGININVSPELDSIEIINNFSNVSIGNLLFFWPKSITWTLTSPEIISISKFKEPAPHPLEKEIIADYDSQRNLISLDLRNDPLEKVFRKITDVSGKNMVFAPGMENIPLSIYIANVPFEAAMEKLALSNNLKISRSRDGFYIFNSLQALDNSEGVITAITISDNFYYRVLDSVNKIIEVDFKNVPASDIIYSIGEDLNLNIFTSNSLEELGTVTVKAESIHFETLLNKIFESANSAGINSASTNEQANNQGRTGNNLASTTRS